MAPRELWLHLGDGVHSGGAVCIGVGDFDTVIELDAFDEFEKLMSAYQASAFSWMPPE